MQNPVSSGPLLPAMAGLLSAAAAASGSTSTPAPGETAKKQTVRKKRTPAVISTKIKISTAAATASSSKKKSKKDKKLEEVSEAPIEDHIILRLPPSLATQEFRAAVKKRQIPSGFNLNFSEPRTASVRLGVGPNPTESLSAKLVDLPCIIESQKTIDNKQFYKVADICQVCLHFSCGMKRIMEY